MKIKPLYQQIDKKLVRGQYILSPLKVYELKKQNINQIIDLRKGNIITQNIEKFLCKLFGIKYINRPYNLTDKTFVSKDFFLKTNELITKNNGTTYIHCKLGKHRTGLCVAAYEKEVLKKNFDDSNKE